jgi:hypothetical protein
MNFTGMTYEKFEYAKGVTRSRKSKKDREYSGEKKKHIKGQTMIYKMLCRKLDVERNTL